MMEDAQAHVQVQDQQLGPWQNWFKKIETLLLMVEKLFSNVQRPLRGSQGVEPKPWELSIN